ncbi:MAG: hypothetical protein E7502_08320 [Ruminococcus sp.]|jgi:hypothetical protein|nr:hypothetical protein [Ruminococcus sp.]
MQELVKEYEWSASRLQGRIQQLNKALREDDYLGNQERDILLLRRNLLMAERVELLHDIEQMQSRGWKVGC